MYNNEGIPFMFTNIFGWMFYLNDAQKLNQNKVFLFYFGKNKHK